MNSEEEVEPPQKKTKLLPLSFSSLPDEIIVDCFARISKSCYPSLSLVSKAFRSLISSQELYAARSQIRTTELCLFICLRFSTVPCTEPTQRWFSLWVKPKQNLFDGRVKEKSSGNLFVPCLNSPPSYPNPSVTNVALVMDKVMYFYSQSKFIMGYDLEAGTCREVRGLGSLKKYRSLSKVHDNCKFKFVNYGGKLVILWDRFERRGRSRNKNIWCAMVTMKKYSGGIIAGNIEWVDVVLTVPKTYEFECCLSLSV